MEHNLYNMISIDADKLRQTSLILGKAQNSCVNKEEMKSMIGDADKLINEVLNDLVGKPIDKREK